MSWYTATGASGAAVTLTLPANGVSVYTIYWLEIECYNSAARAGGAAPVTVTTTNLAASNPSFDFQSAGAVGTNEVRKVEAGQGIACQSAGAVTIVCPATVGIIWKLNCVAVP